ncbi:MAG: hypothetical protein P4L74_00485 [Candidatus Doudnabacteria bacterium]|nr:hypothetical protein [Candidatus Doudnabacteria bacterium]
MPKKDSTAVNEVLFWLYETGKLLSVIFASKHEWKRRMWNHTWGNYNNYKSTVYHMREQGLVEIVSKDGLRFLKLTSKGQMEALLAKAKVVKRAVWDKKWRVLIFDIPEDAKLQRNQFRRLLKRNEFKKLQASVYVNPYPFNREAIEYLKESGLIKYIRILKVEEMDSDADLRKMFNI